MPDIDAFIVELIGMRAHLEGDIVRLRHDQRETAAAAAAVTDVQVLILTAAIHDIDRAIKTYRSSNADRP